MRPAAPDDGPTPLLDAETPAAYDSARLSAAHSYTAALALDERSTAFGQDPNAIAIIIAVAFPMVCLFLFDTKSWRRRVALLGVLGVYIVGIASTGSRTGVGAVALAAALVALMLLRRSALRMLIAGAILFAVVGRYMPGVVGERVLGRLQLQSDLNSRVEIWDAAREPFLIRPIQGWGAGTFPNVIKPFYGAAVASHNVLVSFAIEIGVIGVAMFLALVYLAVRPLVQRGASAEARTALVMVAVCSVGAATLTLTAEKLTWFVFALAIAAGKHSFNRSADIGPDATAVTVEDHSVLSGRP